MILEQILLFYLHYSKHFYNDLIDLFNSINNEQSMKSNYKIINFNEIKKFSLLISKY